MTIATHIADTTSAPRIESVAAAGKIVVHNVSKSYGSGRFAKAVVRDCSFTVEPGKLSRMIGPSGCGKSTLIRLLAGFEPLSGGSLTRDGKPIAPPAPPPL